MATSSGSGAGPEGAWLALIVFDLKNDDRKILVGSSWGTVKDQEMWTKIVKTKTTSDGDFSLVWAGYDYRTTGVQEIWGPDNQLYGFIIYQQTMVDSVDVKLVDENTMQLSWQRGLRFYCSYLFFLFGRQINEYMERCSRYINC